MVFTTRYEIHTVEQPSHSGFFNLHSSLSLRLRMYASRILSGSSLDDPMQSFRLELSLESFRLELSLESFRLELSLESFRLELSLESFRLELS
ncbi:hypothetical protein TNCT_368821 [Trichonephila clavata]|uniref:Uncharacterized protein n=1 Tax=Trichonephila clavata TaxID=2740835 RepID=A0A8X6G5K4_TRICU|nr:hypothetical protein TNCT_368821 [Trichonephila clavata]